MSTTDKNNDTPAQPTPSRQQAQSAVQHYSPQGSEQAKSRTSEPMSPEEVLNVSGQQRPKPQPIPPGMPTISENHKQTHVADKKPFEREFLAPKYWPIWLAAGIAYPIIYTPLRFQFWLGRQLGKAFYHLLGSRRKTTLVNLKLAFPEKMEEERVRMAKQVFINQGIGIFETLCAWFRPDVFTRTISISGIQHVIAAQQAGKAVLLLGGHYTMLDLGGRLFTQFAPVDCVYRPQNNKLLEWFIYNGRRNIFDEQIEYRNMRKLISRLKQGKIVWYSPDQDYGLKHGVMAPFFGVPAATLTAPRRIARMGDKSNPPALMALHTYRQSPDKLERGRRPHYHLTITPALENYPSKDEVADAKRVNDLIEGLIRIDPTQWMWFHRRFKNSEKGRTDYYD